MKAIEGVVVEAIAAESRPAVDQVPGVRALDLWTDGRNGAVLFWVAGEADLDGSGEPVLYEVYAERVDGGWRPTTWASATSEPMDELLAGAL